MRLTVNGVAYEVASAPLTPLLSVLRDELDITSPKAGCQEGTCGTCTVLVDGEPRRSCLLALGMAGGHEVTTVEGLGSPRKLHELQAAFHYYYASQCGFCTPGMVLASVALLQRERRPTRRQIQHALAGHLCRCTGYVKILDAVEAVARGETFDGAEQTRSSSEPAPEAATAGRPV